MKAETLSLPIASDVHTEPESCISSSGVCAIQVPSGKKYELKLAKSTIVVDQGSALIRLSDSHLSLVSGTIWIQSEQTLTVSTEFGSAKFENGQFWVTRDKDRMFLATVEGEGKLQPRGSVEELLVEPGMENWIGRVGSNGWAVTGIPTAIPLEAHLRRWARLYSGKRSDFEKQVEAFGVTWTKAKENASEIHRILFERKLASIEADAKKKLIQSRIEASRNSEFSEMFRRRFLLLDPQ